MILALLYCLKHQIQFRLTSANANFAVDKGLMDYFLPFFTEDINWYNRYFNTRPYYGLKRGKHRYLAKPVKLLYGIDYFTQDVWQCFRSKGFQKEQFDYQQLGIKGDLLQATSVVIQQIWQFQPAVQKEIKEAIAQLALPKDYIGFHIRRGDKILETKRVSTAGYFSKAEQQTNLRSAFIVTDDYQVITEVKENFPHWTIYTLCDETAKGYVQKAFDQQDKASLYQAIIRLLAAMEILYAAHSAFITYRSNVGMFLGMRRGHAGHPQIYSLDLPQWQI